LYSICILAWRFGNNTPGQAANLQHLITLVSITS
jgi:hypothetical protein